MNSIHSLNKKTFPFYEKNRLKKSPQKIASPSSSMRALFLALFLSVLAKATPLAFNAQQRLAFPKRTRRCFCDAALRFRSRASRSFEKGILTLNRIVRDKELLDDKSARRRRFRSAGKTFMVLDLDEETKHDADVLAASSDAARFRSPCAMSEEGCSPAELVEMSMQAIRSGILEAKKRIARRARRRCGANRARLLDVDFECEHASRKKAPLRRAASEAIKALKACADRASSIDLRCA